MPRNIHTDFTRPKNHKANGTITFPSSDVRRSTAFVPIRTSPRVLDATTIRQPRRLTPDTKPILTFMAKGVSSLLNPARLEASRHLPVVRVRM